MIKVLKRAALILALALVLLCGATVTLMFYRTEVVENKLEPAFVDCVVNETTNSGSATGVTEKSSIKVENTGNIDAYLRVRFVSYWVDAEGKIGPIPSEMPTITTANGWIADTANNTYYYPTAVAPDGFTAELLGAKISLTTKTVNDKVYYQVLEVFADAIQSLPAEAVTNSWGVTVSNGVITGA